MSFLVCSRIGLSGNRLVGNVPSGFAHLNVLQYADLSNNFLTGSVSAVMFLPNLTTVYLDGNLFNDSSFSAISHPHCVLQFVYLHGNRFHEQLSDAYFASCASSLLHIDLSNNFLTGILPTSLCQNSSLLLLSIRNNQFSDFSLQCLYNSSLIWFDADQNNITHHWDYDQCRLAFSSRGAAACSLALLGMSNNLMTGTIADVLRCLSPCRQLQHLDFSLNRFSGVVSFLYPVSQRLYGHTDRLGQTVLYDPDHMREVGFTSLFSFSVVARAVLYSIMRVFCFWCC